MKEMELKKLWKIFLSGKYILLIFTVAGALLGFYFYRTSKPVYQLHLSAVGNGFYLGQRPGEEEEGTQNYFFHEKYFDMNVIREIKGVSLYRTVVGERVSYLVLEGERDKILNALKKIKGLFVKFQISQLAGVRASAVDSAVKRILANEKSMVFFRERIRLAKQSEVYYPKKYSRDSFVFQQVDILPPEAQIYVFKYRIANREATNEITWKFLREDLNRLKRMVRIIETKDEEVGEKFCGKEGEKWVEGDDYLKLNRISICAGLSSILISKKWEKLPSSSPWVMVSWALAGFLAGVFLVFFLGFLKEVNSDERG